MFLNYRRSFVRYIVLWICTLGFYHIIFRRQITDDTNKMCPGLLMEKPGFTYWIAYVLTLGIYGIVEDLQYMAAWRDYLNERGVYCPPYEKRHLLLGIIPFIRIISIPSYFKMLNLTCKAYSDAQLEYDEDEDKEILSYKRTSDEKKLHDEEHEVAGVQIVAEYNFEDDRRRRYVPDTETEKASEPEKEEPISITEVPAEVPKSPSQEPSLPQEPILPQEPEEPAEDTEAHYRNKRWFRRVFAAMLAVFMLPFITVFGTVFALPAVYENTFVGELGEKYDRLCSIDEPKIVVIGGSSVAFGLDSALMEKHLGMPVVNFGLYANLGTKLMMDLSKANINEGDIIVLAPEMNDQTLSLYFNSETTLQALDGNMNMLLRVDTGDYESLIGASWKFAGDKLSYILNGTLPQNDGAYKKENFNKYGDNIYDRPYNTMINVQKGIDLDFRVNRNDSINSEYEQYIDYVNEYTAYARYKGAEVYFSFPPMDEDAFADGNTSDYIYQFYKNLSSALDCRVISSIEDYILDDGYFFDSEFHLNNAGVVIRTVRLIDDLKREFGINTVTVPESELPEPPGRKPLDIVEGDEENLYFILEKYEKQGDSGSETYYVVTGLNDEGKKQKTLTVPNNVDGIPVTTIGYNAFKGCNNLETLYLGENIYELKPRAFSEASSLTSVFIPDGTPVKKISVPTQNNGNSEFMTDDCNPALKIYIDQFNYQFYVNDYFWSDYGAFLATK